MAFYKKQKLNGKWYPRAITKGRTATTDDVAKRLSLISTVSPEEVSSQQITDTKVRFIPEYSREQNNRVTDRTLIDPYLEWVDFDEIGNNSNK